jgi:uncharacterized protein YndB with AHSA1/START domain
MQRTEKTIEIYAPVERVFDLFSDFESFPRWMRNIKEVRYTGRRYTRWTADAPFGSSVEWEAETTHFEPDHRIAWRTVRGDVDTEGEVIFEETRYGTTRVRVVLGYDPPAGRLGALVAHLFGKDPEQQLEEDLERFADVVEGRRDKRRAPRDDYERSGRRGAREDYDARDVRRGDGYRSRAYGARDYEDVEGVRERESRARFDEALREARRSQLEGARRYREERERDEQRRHLATRERDEYGRDQRRIRPEQRRERSDENDLDKRGRDDDQRRRISKPVPRPPEDDERRSRSNRYPMTPREWERDTARRQPDYDYSREAFRRGVDKLMDEPPSGRWRRWE